MNSETPIGCRCRRRLAGGLVGWGLSLLAGCGSLLPAPPPAPALFVLGDATRVVANGPATPPPIVAISTLVVVEPRAAPGYGTRQIAYVRTAHQLEYFAFAQWVEPPVQMLAPLLAQAIERTGAFAAVVRAPTSVAADLRLETELVRLYQDFSVVPSRVRLTLRAVLVDTAKRRVLVAREFDEQAASASDDPAGGVSAANEVVARLAAEVAAFCAEGVARRQ